MGNVVSELFEAMLKTQKCSASLVKGVLECNQIRHDKCLCLSGIDEAMLTGLEAFSNKEFYLAGNVFLLQGIFDVVAAPFS